MVNNADWLLKLNYVELLRDVGACFSVNNMLRAECYKQRMEKGLSFLEFNSVSYTHLLGGLSGFPDPSESIADAFIAGHASNAVSVALGMARARTLEKQDYSVIAFGTDGDYAATFRCGGNKSEVIVPSYTGFVGQWGHSGHKMCIRDSLCRW